MYKYNTQLKMLMTYMLSALDERSLAQFLDNNNTIGNILNIVTDNDTEFEKIYLFTCSYRRC